MAGKGTIGPEGLAYALAHAPAGADTMDVVEDLQRRGYDVAGYRLGGQAGAAPQSQPAGFGQEALMTAGAGAAAAGGFAGGERAMQALSRSRTLNALGQHGTGELLADKGPVGAAARLLSKVASARSQPRVSPHLEDLGGSIGRVPESALPPVEAAPVRGPLPEPTGSFGAQTLSTAPSVSQSFATEVPAAVKPAPEPIPFTPSRPISVHGKPRARVPVPTKEPKYTGGRGASGPELARRAEAQAAATGKKVPLGKTGEVIGAVGDEARTAGRHADSLEDLLKRSLEIARKVPAEARGAVFKTVKAASKFAHESDTALGGPAMLFFDLLPESTVQEIMNTRFVTDPSTGKIVKKQLNPSMI